jgi:type I restriction enzyme S subunit
MSAKVKPGYKQTEVGVIPEDWEAKKLGQLASFRTGPFGSALHKADYTNDGVPIVNPMHIVDGQIVPTRTMTVTESAATKLAVFRLSPDEVIIGRRGDMGRCAVVRHEHTGWLCGTGSMIVRPAFGVDAGFFQRVLSSTTIISAIENSSVGSTMINLNQSTLRELAVQVPPFPEQRAIAAALSDVDGLLAKLDQLIAKKRDLKQAAMQQLLTGQTRLPGFSGEWEVKTLGELFNFSGGYSASRDQLSTEGYCYLHYGDIHKSSKTFIDVYTEYQDIPKLDIPLKRVSSGSLLNDGDVVFVDASEDDEGTSKHVVIINKDQTPYISGLHTIVAKGKTNELSHEYRRYCFQTPAIRQQFLFYSVGTKVSGINKANIPKLTLPVPSLTEQTAIAAVLSDMDAEIAALVARRDKTRALKQGMMQELLTGRIRLV